MKVVKKSVVPAASAFSSDASMARPTKALEEHAGDTIRSTGWKKKKLSLTRIEAPG